MYIKHGAPMFSQRDMWSLDETLKPILCSALKKFRESCEHKQGVPLSVLPELPKGYVGHYTDEQLEEGHRKFLEILDKMIYAFDGTQEPQMESYGFDFNWIDLGEGRVTIECTNEDERERYNRDMKVWQEKCLEGRLLFAEHFESLWI